MDALLQYLTNGQYTAACGAALVVLVALARAGLSKKWKWFATTSGGYLVSWSTTSVAYVGAALETNTAISVKLVLTAIGTGLAGSGLFDHISDLQAALSPSTTPPAPPSSPPIT